MPELTGSWIAEHARKTPIRPGEFLWQQDWQGKKVIVFILIFKQEVDFYCGLR